MDLQTAAPLILQTLRQACSQEAGILKPAEQQLKQWETQPGFYSVLLAIFSDHSLEVNVRFLAVLCFKNGVDRYWRKNAPNAISEAEKVSLRQQLISQFNEPISQIATQLSVLISKIARLDCPHSWQDLVPTLMHTIKCDNPHTQQRALLTLHHVVKAMASKRLATDRRLFSELTSNVLDFLLLLWNSHTSNFINAVHCMDSQAAIFSLDHSIFTLKVLRKLVTYGVKDMCQSESGLSFLKLVFQRLEEFLGSKKEMSLLSKDLLGRREKKLTLLSKVLLDIQEYHCEAFVQFIEPSLQLVVNYNFTDHGQDCVFERFTVNTFNLMRTILRCDFYRPAKSIEETKNPLTLEAHKLRMQFFSQSMLSEIVHRLVLHYFPLTQEDLECWDADPENFICDEGGDSWKFSLRPCTENLYLTLMKEHRETVSQVILQLITEHRKPAEPTNLKAILQKDAVYNAVGQAPFDLYDDVDFDQWFTTDLLPELQNNHTNYRIIRRRIVWLLGNWVGVKLSPSLYPMLYSYTIPLLQPEEDLVVRIESALTLKLSVDVFEFKPNMFLPYLESAFSQLFRLLQDVSECESKMQVLHVMSFVIERMRVDIRPHAGALLHYLPSLWEDSVDHNMLRCAIITTLTNLVEGLGVLCVKMYDLLLPIIQLSTDVTLEPHVYLCEDGLDLWHTTLQCSPTLTPGLLELYSNMPALLDLGTETLRTCVKITETYILLGPKDFLQKYAHTLVTSLSSLMTDLKTEGVVMIYKVVELIFKVFPEEGPRMFHSMLPNIFRSIVDGQEYPMVTALQLALFCRIILGNQPFFWDFINEMAVQLNKESGEVLGAMLDNWLDKSDNVIQLERKKLMFLALITLLSANVSVVLERFGGIVNGCVETLHDVYRVETETDLGLHLDCLVINDSDPLPPDELETEHDKRKVQLSLQDPVHAVDMREYFMSHLRTMQEQHGQTAVDALMEQVDPDILTQLRHFMQ